MIGNKNHSTGFYMIWTLIYPTWIRITCTLLQALSTFSLQYYRTSIAKLTMSNNHTWKLFRNYSTYFLKFSNNDTKMTSHIFKLTLLLAYYSRGRKNILAKSKNKMFLPLIISMKPRAYRFDKKTEIWKFYYLK